MTETEEKTEFKFEELSDKAKDTARDAYRAQGQDDEWWDVIYEDAVRMGALIGIEIGTTHHASSIKGHPGYTTIDISFSGFCSQGDGACFEGSYRFKPGAVEAIQTETNDETLLQIATELQTMQLARRLLGLEYFTATIGSQNWGSGNYCHSGTMSVDVNSDDEDDEHCQVGDDLEAEVTQLMRNFADWIYSNLEAQDDYLNSDEYIDERLSDSDDLFDETGREI